MNQALRATLTTGWPLMPGHAIVVRPLLPDDADLVIALGKSLSSESLYQRFLNGGIKQNPQLLSRLVNVDFTRDLALIATATFAGEETPIGVARYARSDSDADAAEIAITLADAWHGRGIGKRLLRTLIARAEADGIDRLTGDVLATNVAMLALARSVGFRVTLHPEESHLRLISLSLVERDPAPLDSHEENDL
jgi:acetyltransferase